MSDEDASPPPTRDQFEHRKDFVRAYDRWRDKHDPRRKKRIKAGLSSDEYQRENYAQNREKRLAEKKALYAAKREMLLERQAKWRDDNRDKLKIRDQRQYERNQAAYFARNAKRRSRRIQATPPWLTKEHWREMAQMYEDAQQMTETTGIAYHVDHIWPLKGRTSCGLHVPWNLRIVFEKDNLRKGNREPDE